MGFYCINSVLCLGKLIRRPKVLLLERHMENWQSLDHYVEKASLIKKFNFSAFLVEPICYYLTVLSDPLTPGILLLSARYNF